ncbi:hypothetical protein J7L87_04890 [bacterium]|nr:hypothetical protein [bacterium]
MLVEEVWSFKVKNQRKFAEELDKFLRKMMKAGTLVSAIKIEGEEDYV